MPSSATAPIQYAVIDVETTGLFPQRAHRIVELAVVVVDAIHGVVDELCTLVNPDRDIGGTSVHGLRASDLVHAPTFEDIAGDFVARVSDSYALVAHNARFDTSFLEYEFTRMGLVWPRPPVLCTMDLARRVDAYSGRSLLDCCDSLGIEFTGKPHQALSDARATAELLLACVRFCGPDLLMKCLGQTTAPAEWPQIPSRGAKFLTREQQASAPEEAPHFLQKLLAQTGDLIATDPGATAEYLDLLDRCMEDRILDDHEHDALFETAVRWGLTAAQVEAAHRQYLRELSIAAWADGMVTEAERTDFVRVARLLGESDQIVDDLLAQGAEARQSAGTLIRATKDLAGQTVCFTGELSGRLAGEPITRERAHLLAAAAGLKVVNSVTKKLSLLVVADPHTQSGKAKKARRYGVRIMHESVFWKALGLETA